MTLFKEETGAGDSDRYVPEHWLSTLSAMFDTPFNGFLGAVSIGRSTGVTIPSPVSENVDIKSISTDHPLTNQKNCQAVVMPTNLPRSEDVRRRCCYYRRHQFYSARISHSLT